MMDRKGAAVVVSLILPSTATFLLASLLLSATTATVSAYTVDDGRQLQGGRSGAAVEAAPAATFPDLASLLADLLSSAYMMSVVLLISAAAANVIRITGAA